VKVALEVLQAASLALVVLQEALAALVPVTTTALPLRRLTKCVDTQFITLTSSTGNAYEVWSTGSMG